MSRTRKLAAAGALALALVGPTLSPAAAPAAPAPVVQAGGQPVFSVKSWPGAMQYGTPEAIEGKLKGPNGAKRVVQLQRQVPGAGWKFVKAARTDALGRFTLTVPTQFYHALPYRLKLKNTQVTNRARKIAVRPAYTPVAPSSAWARIEGGAKFQYNPCQVVRYRVNLNGMDESALADTHTAVRQLSIASGIRFKYAGSTTKIFQDGSKAWPRNTELVVSWASDHETVESFAEASAWGGAEKAVWARSPKFGRVGKIVRGGVVVNKDASWITPGSGPLPPSGTVPRVQLLMHELAHTVGLGHVLAHPGQIMSYEGWTEQWGAGDLTGLKKVGLQSGCLKPYRPGAGAGPVPAPPVVVRD